MYKGHLSSIRTYNAQLRSYNEQLQVMHVLPVNMHSRDLLAYSAMCCYVLHCASPYYARGEVGVRRQAALANEREAHDQASKALGALQATCASLKKANEKQGNELQSRRLQILALQDRAIGLGAGWQVRMLTMPQPAQV